MFNYVSTMFNYVSTMFNYVPTMFNYVSTMFNYVELLKTLRYIEIDPLLNCFFLGRGSFSVGDSKAERPSHPWWPMVRDGSKAITIAG